MSADINNKKTVLQSPDTPFKFQVYGLYKYQLYRAVPKRPVFGLRYLLVTFLPQYRTKYMGFISTSFIVPCQNDPYSDYGIYWSLFCGSIEQNAKGRVSIYCKQQKTS